MTDPGVLVVESDPDQARTYREWLAEDYRVMAAYTGEDAASFLSSETDVVLLDRRLPDVSGGTLLERFREAGYDGQVAMVTAVEPDDEIVEMGFDDYLQKPVDADQLRSLVASLLARDLYADEVQRYFELSAKRSALETGLEESELEDSENYDGLREAIATLEDRLGSVLSNLSEEAFVSVFRDLEMQVPAGEPDGQDGRAGPGSTADDEAERDAN